MKKLSELCPGWGCCILAREDLGLLGALLEGRLLDSHGGAGKGLAWQEEV